LQVNGPLVLQLQKARNVCMPKSLEDSAVKSSGSQLLRLTLTDGQQTMCALEMDGQTGLGYGDIVINCYHLWQSRSVFVGMIIYKQQQWLWSLVA